MEHKHPCPSVGTLVTTGSDRNVVWQRVPEPYPPEGEIAGYCSSGEYGIVLGHMMIIFLGERSIWVLVVWSHAMVGWIKSTLISPC